MARIVWSAAARSDLQRIVSSPEFGRLVPEDLSQTYRELIFGNYRIVYRYSANTVTIVTVIHGARILRL